MSNKDFLVCVVFAFVLMFAIKFAWKWFNNGFNDVAVREWLNRGFLFGLGFLIALLTVILVLKIISEYL